MEIINVLKSLTKNQIHYIQQNIDDIPHTEDVIRLKAIRNVIKSLLNHIDKKIEMLE